MVRLDYDEDNFSGIQVRGTRYDISKEAVDKLCEEMERKPWLYGEIEVIEIKK